MRPATYRSLSSLTPSQYLVNTQSVRNAAAFNDIEWLRYLLQNPPVPGGTHLQHRAGNAAVQATAACASLAFTCELLDSGIASPAKLLRATVHFGAQNSPLLIAELADRGVDLCQLDSGGWSALHEAASSASVPSVRALLAEVKARGGDHQVLVFVNAVSAINARSALHLACRRGSLEICKALVVAGANIQLGDRDGLTAAAIASKRGFKEVAGYLKSFNDSIAKGVKAIA